MSSAPIRPRGFRRNKLKTEILGLPTAFEFHGSVVPKTLLPCSILTLWSVVVFCANRFGSESLNISNTIFITVTSLVLALLLGFRTNNANSQFVEGSRLWAALGAHLRTIFRLSRVLPPKLISSEKSSYSARRQEESVARIVNLGIAFSIALRNQLRGDYGLIQENGNLRPEYNGLLPTRANDAANAEPFTLNYPHSPQFILHLLSRELANRFREELLDAAALNASLSALASLTEILANMERILFTPLPVAYNVHLNQTIYLYLFLLPLQLYKPLGILMIPATYLASFVVVGVELIGREIENPFGKDINDLPIDKFISKISLAGKAVLAQNASELSVLMFSSQQQAPDK